MLSKVQLKRDGVDLTTETAPFELGLLRWIFVVLGQLVEWWKSAEEWEAEKQ